MDLRGVFSLWGFPAVDPNAAFRVQLGTRNVTPAYGGTPSGPPASMGAAALPATPPYFRR